MRVKTLFMHQFARKKIAMFCHDDPLAPFGSQESGGQGVYVYSLIKELDKMGWSVDAFTRWDSIHKKTIALIGKKSRVIRLKCGPVKYISRRLLTDLLPEFYNNFLSFINNINQYDIFHGHYWDGGWLAMKASEQFKIPFIQNFHSLGKIRLKTKENFPFGKGQDRKDDYEKRFAMEEEIAKKADIIISLADVEKKDLETLYNANSSKILVIPGGVNLDSFKPIDKTKAREKLCLDKINGKNFILLFVGRLEWRKGAGTLIHATKLLEKDVPEIKTIIIGGKIYGKQKNVDDLREYHRLLEQVKEKNIENIVTFCGMIDHDRLPLFYSAADVFIVPSYYEPFGLVALESMACKNPVIASNVGGLATIIKNNENGLLAKPRNPLDLKNKVLELYKSKELRNKLSENAYDYVWQNYSWQKITKKIVEAYNQITSSHKYENSSSEHK